jgi:hypothetical protein
MPSLLVITGSIGAGKSTVSTIVGRRLSRGSRDAAVVDVDDVVFMQHVRGLESYWARGCAAHAALVAEWFSLGVEIVIAEGPLVAPNTPGYDLRPLIDAVPSDVEVSHALLRVPVEVALERVRSDPERGENAISRDEAFLRQTHEAFAAALADAPEFRWDFDTTQTSARDIAEVIAADVLATTAAHEEESPSG